MTKKYIYNPKTQGSGIITCIPQTGKCPNGCSDCFFQSGRSYLEPLSENLPQIPDLVTSLGRVVRINDGNDSNVDRDLVEEVSARFQDCFFNTAIPHKLEKFTRPVVLTVNPSLLTDDSFRKLEVIPDNLMFVRIRSNMWNVEKVIAPAVAFYTSKNVPVVLTFMAYYTDAVPEVYRECYEWKKRTLNSYWVLKREYVDKIMTMFKDNPFVYSCGVKGRYECKFCGNCIREYYNTKERIRIREE